MQQVKYISPADIFNLYVISNIFKILYVISNIVNLYVISNIFILILNVISNIFDLYSQLCLVLAI
jgi:hypothetical protein